MRNAQVDFCTIKKKIFSFEKHFRLRKLKRRATHFLQTDSHKATTLANIHTHICTYIEFNRLATR